MHTSILFYICINLISNRIVKSRKRFQNLKNFQTENETITRENFNNIKVNKL